MKLLIVLTLIVVPLSLYAKTYQVKAGEQLGEILHHQGYAPIWGKNGSVKKAIALNPKSIKQNGDFIIQEALIELPAEPTEKVEKLSFNKPLHQIIEFKNSAPQVIHLNHEEVVISAAISTKALSLDGKDKASGSKETLKNVPAPGIRLSFDHKHKENRAYGLFFSSNRLDFNKPTGKTLKNQNKSYNEYGLSMTYDLNETKVINVSLSLEERPLLFLNSNSDLELKRATIPKLAFTYSNKVLERKRLKINGFIGAAFLAPMKREDYYVNGGHDLFTGLVARYTLTEKMELTSGLAADFSGQHTSQNENKYSEFSLNLGLSFLTDASRLDK